MSCKLLFSFIMVLLLVHGCFSINCYKCHGRYSYLNNDTCSIVTQNDTCFISVQYLPASGDFMVDMNGFNETNSSAGLPVSYVKPKSGSSFSDFMWGFSYQPEDKQLFTARFFCYKDNCNQFEIIGKLLSSKLKYKGFNAGHPISKCLKCEGDTYNSVANCVDTTSCSYICYLTANQTLNDLYNYANWSSSCLSFKYFPIGFIAVQYETLTGLINKYVFLDCNNETCNSFEFINNFLNSIQQSNFPND